ncbi:MAG: porin family protein [Halioglobus sp.]
MKYALPLSILLTAVCSRAIAADESKSSGFYGRLALGQSTIDFDSELEQATKSDNTDFSWEVGAGYQFNKKWSIELAWLDMGDHSVSGPLFLTDAATQKTIAREATAEAQLHGAVVRAIRTFHFTERLNLSVKAGVYAWDQDGEGRLLAEESRPEVSFDLDKSGYDITYGLSAGYKLKEGASVALEWDHHSIFDADVFSISLKKKF